MSRHSDGKNNYAVAPWLIIVALLTLLALIAGAFFLFRGGDTESGEASSVAAGESTVESTAADESETTAAEATSARESSSAAASSTSQESSSAAPSSEKKDTVDKPAGKADSVAPNTLFLLDTSANLTPYFGPVSQAVADAANAAGEDGGQVGLWNYSSPISESATVGYRQNVAYGPAENVAFAVSQFGTGGVPQTRSAVIAALGNAADQAAETGSDARVVLVTTGTEQDMDDETFSAALKDARAQGVSLSVVHVGDGEKDAALEQLADVSSAITDPSDSAADAKAISAAAGV